MISIENFLLTTSGFECSSIPKMKLKNSNTNSHSGTPRRRKAKSFCRVCNSDIAGVVGTRNQGPRRHIQRYHITRPMFGCSICDYKTVYDKAHVLSHLKRIHKNDPAAQIVELDCSNELEHWYEVCFGEGKVPIKMETPKITPPRGLRKKRPEPDLPFSITRILNS